MDPRLEVLTGPIISPESAVGLCTCAILYAKNDLGQTETDLIMGNFLTVHLGLVLAQGLTSSDVGDTFNLHQAEQQLSEYAHPFRLLRRGQSIGDICLFLSSQELWSERTASRIAPQLIGLGQRSYMIAAANANDWGTFNHRFYTNLAERFHDHSSLLAAAGVLLGFDLTVEDVIHVVDPIVSIEDVLEAISIFAKEPIVTNWETLSERVAAHRRTHDEFSFTLPPRPVH